MAAQSPAWAYLNPGSPERTSASVPSQHASKVRIDPSGERDLSTVLFEGCPSFSCTPEQEMRDSYHLSMQQVS